MGRLIRDNDVDIEKFWVLMLSINRRFKTQRGSYIHGIHVPETHIHTHSISVNITLSLLFSDFYSHRPYIIIVV